MKAHSATPEAVTAVAEKGFAEKRFWASLELRRKARRGGSEDSQKGAMSLELALLVIVVLGALMLVTATWRMGQTRGEVRDVAAEAARAASLRQSASAARQAAIDAAHAVLDRSSLTCVDLSVAPDVSNLRPGGSVSVTIRCDTNLEDLVLLRMPGKVRFETTSIEVVDRRRGGR